MPETPDFMTATPEALEESRKARVASDILRAGIPRRYREGFALYDPDHAPECAALLTAAREWAGKFVPSITQGLALTRGVTGCGKTLLAAGIACHIIEQQYADRGVLWHNVADLFLRIRATWRRNATESEDDIINEAASAGLLILDDFGVVRSDPRMLETLYSLINRADNNGTTIVFTSNYGGKELAEHLAGGNSACADMAGRIMSRLYGMCARLGGGLPWPSKDFRMESDNG